MTKTATPPQPPKRLGRTAKELTGDGFAVRVARALRLLVADNQVDRDWVCQKLGFTYSVYYRIYNAASPAAAGEHLDSLCRLFGLTLGQFLERGAPPAERKSDVVSGAKNRARRGS